MLRRFISAQFYRADSPQARMFEGTGIVPTEFVRASDAQATIADLQGQVEAHKLVIADHHRLVRELDVAINGIEGAAKQASLCDLVSQITALQQRVAQLEGERKQIVEIVGCAPAYLVETLQATKADHARVLGSIETIRDAVLNGRGPLAEMDVDNDVINAVLAIIDDNSLPAQPAQGGA